MVPSPEVHLPYLPIYYGAYVAEKIVAPLTHTKPVVTQLGAMMFGSDNKHSVEKARRELGFAPKVDAARRHQAGGCMVQCWWHGATIRHAVQLECTTRRSIEVKKDEREKIQEDLWRMRHSLNFSSDFFLLFCYCRDFLPRAFQTIFFDGVAQPVHCRAIIYLLAGLDQELGSFRLGSQVVSRA